MKEIIVHAKPSASRTGVEKMSESEYRVSTPQPPIQGKANRAIMKLLADYFHVAPSAIEIIRGRTARIKTIRIT